MSIYRCASCGFIAEAGAGAGGKLPCAKCGTASTLFGTTFYVQKLVERYLAVRRELEALRQTMADPDGETPVADESMAAGLLNADDLNNTDLLATETQHQPLRDWFGARRIETTVDLSAVDTTGYFDEAALQIGERHALLAGLIEKVRYVYRQNFSWVKFNLAKYGPADRQRILDFCRQLYGNTLFARYSFKKQTQDLELGIQPAKTVREFFMGAWLEWYVFATLLRVCVEKKREFSCARQLLLALPNGVRRELDVAALVDGRTLIVIECKTGEFRADIAKYVDLRQRLGMDRTQFVICNPELQDDQLAGLSRMYDLTFTNLGSLRTHLEALI